jgi:photosystem II stability/assembly factor-like uncharacterized protein
LKRLLLKKFIYAITCLIPLTVSVSSTDYWVRQQTPTLAWLHKISFTDSLSGWATGDSGRIIHTSNGGQNWVIQNSGINYFIDDIFFLNNNLGWAIANNFFSWGTTILYTTNGGIIWNSYRYPDTTLTLNIIYFLDSLNGWLAGYDRAILQTTNGGLNWTRRQIDSGDCAFFPIRGLKFYSPQYAFGCGGYFDVAGHVLKTVNGGLTWTPACISFEPIFDIVFLDSLNLIGAGGDYEYGASIVRTSNAGLNWAATSLNYFGAGGAISFRTRAEGWVPLGFAGTWAYTLDSGRTWSQLNAPDSSSVYDVFFTDSLHGWACGSTGMILKYNAAVIGIQNQNQNYPQTDILHQNYPNPFNPATTIEFSIAKTSRVKITIYDVLGRELTVLLNEIRRTGNYKIKFTAERLASGVYFYTLTTGSFTETKKLVILK